MTLQIVRALRKLVKPEPHVPVNLIPLARACVCVESTCEMVWHADEAQRCPACGSDGGEDGRREVVIPELTWGQWGAILIPLYVLLILWIQWCMRKSRGGR